MGRGQQHVARGTLVPRAQAVFFLIRPLHFAMCRNVYNYRVAVQFTLYRQLFLLHELVEEMKTPSRAKVQVIIF